MLFCVLLLLNKPKQIYRNTKLNYVFRYEYHDNVPNQFHKPGTWKTPHDSRTQLVFLLPISMQSSPSRNYTSRSEDSIFWPGNYCANFS